MMGKLRWILFPEFQHLNRNRRILLAGSAISSGFFPLRFSYFSHFLEFSFVYFSVLADRPVLAAAAECGWAAPGTAAVRGGGGGGRGAAGGEGELGGFVEEPLEAGEQAGAGETHSGGKEN